jgi:hypothetical protein
MFMQVEQAYNFGVGIQLHNIGREADTDTRTELQKVTICISRWICGLWSKPAREFGFWAYWLLGLVLCYWRSNCYRPWCKMSGRVRLFVSWSAHVISIDLRAYETDSRDWEEKVPYTRLVEGWRQQAHRQWSVLLFLGLVHKIVI